MNKYIESQFMTKIVGIRRGKRPILNLKREITD